MALIRCPKCGKEISDKAYECIHCGYSKRREEEQKIKEKEYWEIKQKEEERKKEKIRKRRKNLKRNVLIVCILIVICCLSFGISDIVISRADFNKGMEYLKNKDFALGEQYIYKSGNVWLNTNDYDQMTQLCLELGEQCINEGDYESARSCFYLTEKDIGVAFSSFISQAIENNNFEKARDMILYKSGLAAFDINDDVPNIYLTAVEYFSRKEYDKSLELFEVIADYGYGDTAQYLDDIMLYEELSNGEISIKHIAKAESMVEFEWDEAKQQVLAEAKDYMQRLQGCYMGGRPYYFYVSGYNIYWGDETGVENFTEEAGCCKYVMSSQQVEIGPNLGESYIGIRSANEIFTNIRSYVRVNIDELPDTFAPYIDN